MGFDVLKRYGYVLVAGNYHEYIRTVFIMQTVYQKAVHGRIGEAFAVSIASSCIEIFEGLAFNEFKPVPFIVYLSAFFSPLCLLINKDK